MTDNGNCYRSQTFRQACANHGLRHLRTRPYTPRTNGKAERFTQTSLREWAYAQPYVSSQQRRAALTAWSTSTIARGHIPPWAAAHRQRGCSNISCFYISILKKYC
jgi:transposase InsO family protein